MQFNPNKQQPLFDRGGTRDFGKQACVLPLR